MNVEQLTVSSALPWGTRFAAVLALVIVLIVFAGCGPDEEAVTSTTRPGGLSTGATTLQPPATATTTATTTAATTTTTTFATTAVAVAAATEGTVDGTVLERRVAFLIAMLNDPASATDDELAVQFAPSFLAAVPADAIRRAVTEATAEGRAPWTERSRELHPPSGGVVTVVSADGVELTIVLELDATDDQRIAGAQLVPGSAAALEDAFSAPGTIDEIDAALDEVASRVVYAVFDAGDGGCSPLLARSGETAAPTGSTFKLWVLATLARAVRDGDAAWDETVEVTDDLRSSPDGQIYPMPTGTPVTLQRLAELMISISDNTATDLLVARLGRTAIEATMAELGLSTVARNTPFLSTADLFKLKFVEPSLGDRYLLLDGPEQRRAFLDGEVAALPLPWVSDPGWTGDPSLLTVPQRIDEIEWFANPRDLCVTFHDLDRLASSPGLEPVAEILELNPGLPFPTGKWSTIRSKGGSEPGVVMFAYWLVSPTGERRVVVISLSDPAVAFSELDATVPAARLLGLVAQQR